MGKSLSPEDECPSHVFAVLEDGKTARCERCGLDVNYISAPEGDVTIETTRGIGTRPPQDVNLRRLIEFVNGEMYSINWVRLHLVHMSRIPAALPSPTLWKVPEKIEMAKLVYDVVTSPGYVENQWPVMQILMGPSIDNAEWSVGVLTTLALFDAIRLLPYATMGD